MVSASAARGTLGAWARDDRRLVFVFLKISELSFVGSVGVETLSEYDAQTTDGDDRVKCGPRAHHRSCLNRRPRSGRERERTDA